MLNIKQKLEFLNINQKQEPEPQYPAMKLNKGISNDLSKSKSSKKEAYRKLNEQIEVFTKSNSTSNLMDLQMH